MKIKFTLEASDLLALQAYHMKTSSTFKWLGFFYRYGFPLFLFFQAAKGYFDNESQQFVGYLPAILFAAMGLGWLIFFDQIRKRFYAGIIQRNLRKKQNESVMGPMEVLLEEEGVRVIKDESEHKYAWSAIKSLGHSQEHYFLYNSANSAIIIPKHRIGNQLADLENLLSEKFEGSEPLTLGKPPLEQILRESRVEVESQDFKQTNKKLWIAAAILSVLAVAGMPGLVPETGFDGAAFTFGVLGIPFAMALIAGIFALITAALPYKDWSFSWRFLRAFLISYLVLAALVILVTVMDYLVG